MISAQRRREGVQLLVGGLHVVIDEPPEHPEPRAELQVRRRERERGHGRAQPEHVGEGDARADRLAEEARPQEGRQDGLQAEVRHHRLAMKGDTRSKSA